MGLLRNPRERATDHLATKLALIALVGVIMIFGTPEPFTTKHLLILATTVLVVFGTPWLRAFLVRLRLM